MFVYDSIAAHEIEDGDQILVDSQTLENVRVSGDPDNHNVVIVTGFSFDTGDDVTITIPFDHPIDLWTA